jgi:hypothetical protein
MLIAVPAPMGLLDLNDAREQNVVLQVDVLMKIRFQFLQTAVQSPVGSTRVFRERVAARRLSHLVQTAPSDAAAKSATV